MLTLALGMLVVGQLWLKDRMSAPQLLAYWGVCFLLTSGALLVALLEMRTVRRRTREEHRRVFEETLGPIPPQPPTDTK